MDFEVLEIFFGWWSRDRVVRDFWVGGWELWYGDWYFGSDGRLCVFFFSCIVMLCSSLGYVNYEESFGVGVVCLFFVVEMKVVGWGIVGGWVFCLFGWWLGDCRNY